MILDLEAVKKAKSIGPGKPTHQQQSPEMIFHGHRLRQISRREQAIVPKYPKKRRQQAGSSLEDQTFIRKDVEQKYENVGTLRKARTILRKDPRKKCENPGTSC